MPPSDYRALHDHGHHAAVAAPMILWRVRAWWSRFRLRNDETAVDAHRLR